MGLYLRVLDGGENAELAEVPRRRGERRVLIGLLTALDDAIIELPDASHWRWSLMGIRRLLAEYVGRLPRPEDTRASAG